MPKSGHMANSHAKVAAAAIVAELGGLEVNQTPVLTNTCYSFVSVDEVCTLQVFINTTPKTKPLKQFRDQAASLRKRVSLKVSMLGLGPQYLG